MPQCDRSPHRLLDVNMNILDSMLPLYSRMGIPQFRFPSSATSLLISAVFMCALSVPCHANDAASGLPDAPQPNIDRTHEKAPTQTTSRGRDNMVFGVHVGPGYPEQANKWDTIINPGERGPHLGAVDKLLYAGHEQLQPVVFAPALLSAGWGQLTDANPHYGVDAGGFGERFGSAMLRQATDRISGDGIFAAAFRQDPRYYREAHGTYVHRGLLAVRQTFLRRSDTGTEQVNASGILGHAAGNYLAMTYYPHVSATVGVASSGFATSMAADVGSKLIFEFGPDLLHLVFRRNQ